LVVSVGSGQSISGIGKAAATTNGTFRSDIPKGRCRKLGSNRWWSRQWHWVVAFREPSRSNRKLMKAAADGAFRSYIPKK
jgi:hypothetical protein